MEIDRDDDRRTTGGGRVRHRENIQATVEERMYPHRHMTTLEMVLTMKYHGDKEAMYRSHAEKRCREDQKARENNGVTELYKGEGRGYNISSGEKAVGCVTNLAESKI